MQKMVTLLEKAGAKSNVRRLYVAVVWVALCWPRSCCGVFTDQDCQEINGSCHCAHNEVASQVIRCGGTSGRITVEVNNKNQVHAACEGSDDWSELVPAIDIGPVLFCQITGCLPFADVLMRLHIVPTGILHLQNDGSGANLSRQALACVRGVPTLTLTGYAHLPADLFEDFARLQSVEVKVPQERQLQLPAGLLHPVQQLKGLELRGQLTHLPAHIFGQHRQLSYLRLPDNRLQQLRGSDFANFTQLRSLYLQRNGIVELRADVLSLLRQLTIVDLSENQLRTLPPALFANQLLLRYVYLSNNRLEVLSAALFRHTVALEEIDLSHNRLREVPRSAFSTLTYLRKLQLDNNQLKTITAGTFAHNRNLKHLYLDSNDIRIDRAHVCGTFGNLTSLIELHLNNNSMTQFNVELCIPHYLRLDLSYNKMTTLLFHELVVLACNSFTVDLSNNQIQNLSFEVGNAKRPVQPLPCRSEVILNHNPLNCDCTLVNLVTGAYKGWLGEQVILNHRELSCATPAELHNRPLGSLQPLELRCPLPVSLCPPPPCRCWSRTYDAMMVVNCTAAHLEVIPALLPPLTQWSLNGTELHVAKNALHMLPINSTRGYSNVKRLYAAGNALSELVATQLPLHLTHLDVRHNRLRYLNVSVLNFLNDSRTLEELYLSHNPWVCNCEAEQLLAFIKANYKRIPDADQVVCAEAQFAENLLELNFVDICPPLIEDPGLLILAVSMLAVGLLLAVVIALYYKYELELKVWLYAHNLCLCCVNEAELDRDKTYDAFISYSHKDSCFVEKQLLPGLESEGPISFKVCTHSRDWVVGAFIPELIVESVERSRRTILVLSQNFIESTWALMEFRTAHQCALNEGRTRIIIIVYGDLDNVESLEAELQAYLKMNTYLKWGDPRFWEKLRYAMPHSRRYDRSALRKNEANGIQLETIKRPARRVEL